jgi:hypothetical protein
VARSAIRHSGLNGESIRLAPGSHSSPQQGVCAAELASLLAGEEFSDHPRCVCRVIAAYLRSFNDRVSHADRQRLIPYAARAVGSRAGRAVTHERRDICLVWAGAPADGGPLRSFSVRLAMRLKIWVVAGPRQALRLDEGAGEYAARVVFARYGTRAAFDLLDRLLAVGEADEPEAIDAPGNGRPLEPASLADPIKRPAQPRVAAAIRHLAGDAQVAKGENGGQPANGNGHARDLGGRHARNGHEEGVEDDRAGDGDPERETKTGEHPHDLARVP